MMQYLLSILIWLPVFGGLGLLLIGDDGDSESPRAGMMRNVALAVSIATFLLSTGLYTGFDFSTASMQFVEPSGVRRDFPSRSATGSCWNLAASGCRRDPPVASAF